MQIKKIKKVASNKYKIDFTNGDSIITYDNVILENNILLKKEIDDSLYEEGRNRITTELAEKGAIYLGERYGLHEIRYSYEENSLINKIVVYWCYQ